MMASMGRLAPGNQVYQSSGESTPAAKLPEKYISTPPPKSPLTTSLTPRVVAINPLTAPIVRRAPRMNGIRHLYNKGHRTMPIMRLGADGPPNPWTSSYQRESHGPIRNAGFNDALYQAGYPGYNLGLSFKVQTLPQNQTVPTRGFQKTFNISQKLTRVRRATSGPTGA
jgi:hypothetical protein